jgi:VanZ family protein
MRRLFIVICALLAYGSFYPWQFHFWGPLWPAMLRVFHSWPDPVTFSIAEDMALNVVVYAPLGLTGYLSGAAGFRWRRALWPIAAGFLLSLTVETLQSFIPGRMSSGADLFCNTLGAALGVGMAALYESAIASGLQRLNRKAMRPSSALMMLLIFAGHYLMPLTANAIKLMSTFHRPRVLPTVWSWEEFLNAFVSWLLAGRFAEAVFGPRSGASLAMAGALLLACLTRLASPNLLFSLSMLAGAVAGVALWKLVEGREWVLVFALLTGAWLIADGLRPYTFTDHKPFEWVPFLGMMGADWTNGVSTLLTKAWMYGAAFWTWERTGLPRPFAMGGLLVLLAGIEVAQMYLPGRVSTMTDIAMGIIAASLLWAVERKYGI